MVSRAGRPDLASVFLPKVTSPTLLVVGEQDELLLELNKRARMKLNKQSKLSIVPHATHLFEEPGALQKVAQLSARWFIKYLPASHTKDGKHSSCLQ